MWLEIAKLVEIAQQILTSYRENFKQAEEQRRNEQAKYFEGIANRLREVAKELDENKKVDRAKWSQLKFCAENSYKALSGFRGKM